MKKCRICNELKPTSDFHKDSKNKDGLEGRCKPCILQYKSKNYYKNHEKNKEMARLKSLDFRKNNKGYQRKYDLKRTYGISEEEYVVMLEYQNNKCKICKTEEPGGRHNRFVVDHCHVSGHVRGLLCTGCNLALGGFRDNIKTLLTAIEYLESKGNI